MTFEVTLRDRTIEVVDGVDGYQQEGQMTTFFLQGSGRHRLDAWAERVASFRTSEVLAIRRACVQKTVPCAPNRQRGGLAHSQRLGAR